MHKEPGEGPASVWQEDLASLYSSLSSPQRCIPDPTFTLATSLDLSPPLPHTRKSSPVCPLLTSHGGEGMQVSLRKAGKVGSRKPDPLRVRQISGLSVPWRQPPTPKYPG